MYDPILTRLARAVLARAVLDAWDAASKLASLQNGSAGIAESRKAILLLQSCLCIEIMADGRKCNPLLCPSLRRLAFASWKDPQRATQIARRRIARIAQAAQKMLTDLQARRDAAISLLHMMAGEL